MEKITSGTAEAVFNTLRLVLSNFGIDVGKVRSLGTDGALVMTGSTNGVCTRLKMLNPNTVPVYCVCHRLTLSVSDVCKKQHDVEVSIALHEYSYHKYFIHCYLHYFFIFCSGIISVFVCCMRNILNTQVN